MKNKKFMAFTAVLTAVVLTGSSLAIFAAEPVVPDAEVVETEPEMTEPIAEEAEAEAAVPVVEETEAETTAPVVEETEAEATAPVVDETEAETAADDADYSYHVGQQSSTARNDAYEALPEGGSKEDAEEFYETYEIGGGAWADGAYDESLKSGYGYAEGQQRMAQYAQDGDDDEEYKAGYSYSVGRQSYMENYPNYRK